MIKRLQYVGQVWTLRSGVSPVIKAYGVQKKLNSIFLSEQLPVVFDDGGHVLDMTFIETKEDKLELETHTHSFCLTHTQP